jgi:hypothetical protein
VQCMPTMPGGLTAVHPATDGDLPCLPAGYEHWNNQCAQPMWTDEPCEIPRESWRTSCELKYTNEGMVMCALAADNATAELMSEVDLGAIESPEDWQLVYSRLDQEINKRWGVRGMPCLPYLSYFRYDI